MTDEERKREYEVFNQKLSLEDLDAAGGLFLRSGQEQEDVEPADCVQRHYRPIYGGHGFPNCASSVEDGSWCDKNDACLGISVRYTGRQSCGKAWE